jgi:hypothetical protein
VNSDIAREMKNIEDAHDDLEIRRMRVDMSDKPYFEPTTDRPLRTVVVDATTGVFDYPKAVHLAEDIARHGRKFGLKLQVIVTDVNLTRYELGGSGPLITGAEKVAASSRV